jgi:lysophospholipase L1-like esterase
MGIPLHRRLLYGLVVASFLLGVTEAVLRMAIPKDQWQLSWEREDGLLLYRSRSYVGGPVDPIERQRWKTGELVTRAGTDAVQHDGAHPWRVRTNAEGLREDQETPTTRMASRQMLAIGDSWMFGVSAGQGRTLADHLERLLPPLLGVDDVEVINGGIPGANAFHMLRRWHYLRDRMVIDDLILGLPHNAPDPDVPAARRAWYQNTKGLPAGSLRMYQGLRRIILPFTRPHYPDLLATNKDGDEYAMTVADLSTIATDAKARGIRVWLVLWPNDMVAAQQPGMDLSKWIQPLESQLDGYGGHALSARRCWGFEDTWHPSEAGYAAIAHVLAPVIAGGEPNSVLQNTTPCSDGAGGH